MKKKGSKSRKKRVGLRFKKGFVDSQRREFQTQELGKDLRRSSSVLLRQITFVVEEAPDGVYTAKALGESIFTEAESLAELRTQVRDAVSCHFDEGKRPKMIRLHFVRDEVITAA